MNPTTQFCISTLCFGATLLAADPAKVSRPGEYGGYSSRLYGEVARNSQYITVRDGARLAATIYRPALNGKPDTKRWPVIWEATTTRGRRNTDGTVTWGAGDMAELVKFGYVLVQVERRRLGASMGAMRGYHDWTESLDAYDVTEWLAQQPWSDGNVGVYGCSNTGEAALHAPTAMPPHLKAMVTGCFSWNKFDGLLRGGILANWGTGPQNSPTASGMSAIPVDEDKDGSLLKQAIREHEKQTNLLALWKGIPFRNSWSDLVGSRFWMEGSVSTYQIPIERTGIGIYYYGGFQDDFRREQIVAWANLRNPSKLLIGPWKHCQNQGFDLVTERLRFFDHWLKGVQNGIMSEPPVRYYTSGAPKGQEWRSAARWPLSSEKPTRFYLRETNELAPAAPAGATGKDILNVTYAVGMESRPGTFMMQPPGPLDEKGIVYTAGPLSTDVELSGHPVVHLRVTSTASDGHFFAYLEDVGPDGAASVITDGRLKASLRAVNTPPYNFVGLPYHRAFAEDAEPLSASEPAELVFDMLPLSQVFSAGHRIRLTITGADPREKDRPEVSPAPVVSIYRDRVHPSYVTLPVIPK
jgi:uncharacterized protein